MVIAITDTALQFALARRETLFPDAPIVFSGLVGVDGGPSHRRRCGWPQSRSWGPAKSKLALELQPSRSNACSSWPTEETPGFSSPFEPSSARSSRESAFRSSVMTPCLACRCRQSVPPRSVILYIWHQSRDPGNVVYPDEVAQLVAGLRPCRSTAPAISTWVPVWWVAWCAERGRRGRAWEKWRCRFWAAPGHKTFR